MKKNKNIEISALRIFAAVSEAETLTQAAERLGITQSAVSQTIKQLEIQTETQLVDTRSRPVKLTPSGQVLKDYALQIIDDTRRMLVDVRMTAKGGTMPLIWVWSIRFAMWQACSLCASSTPMSPN